MADEPYVVRERVYQTLRDGRSVLAAAVGDVLSPARAEQLGLLGKGKAKAETGPNLADPYLLEGLEPLEGPEADARATGDTAEARARGGRQPTQAELAIAASVNVERPPERPRRPRKK